MNTFKCLPGVLLILLFFALNAGAENPPEVEVRFCPAESVRTYPMETRRDLNSLLLHNVAIVNRSQTPFKINNLEIELLQGNHVVESRKLDRDAIQRLADRGAKLQAGGIL